jgi:CDP-6-deoxy-D-xylo-4-hexulose-3-dehydrase
MIPLIKNAFLNEDATKYALADFIPHAGKLSMDAECGRFERKFAAYHGREAVLFNSGGSANLAML